MRSTPAMFSAKRAWLSLRPTTLFLMALFFCVPCGAQNAQQRITLEEITARSQQSFPETDALILSELRRSSSPQYRLQLLVKQAHLFDLYRRQDRLMDVAKEGQILAREMKAESEQLLFSVMEANALNLIGKSYEAMRIHQSVASKLQGLEPEMRYFGILSFARTHMTLNQNELATKEINSVLNAPRVSATLKSSAALSLAELQIEIGLYGMALEYYRRALETTPTNAHQQLLAAELGIAQSLNALKKHEEALSKIDSIIDRFHQSGNQSYEAYALLLKGYFYARLKNYSLAEAPYLKSAAIYETLNNPSELTNIYSHVASNFADLKKPEKAVQYGEKTVAIALKTDNPNLQWDAYNSLAEAQAAAGQFKSAYQSEFEALKKLLKTSKETLNSQTNLVREQFDTERKEKENTILAEKLAMESTMLASKKREMWILASLISAMAVMLVALFLVYRRTRFLAQHDGLTNLFNRRQVMQKAEQEFSRAKRYAVPLSVVSFDIDHFKAINDQYGHAEGDKVLRCVAMVCNDLVRGSDFVGRLGGEEFLVVLPHSDKEGALKFAERLREKIALVTQQQLGREKITASFGVVQMQSKDENFESLLHRADIAMYHAKSHGRNQCSTVELHVVSS